MCGQIRASVYQIPGRVDQINKPFFNQDAIPI
jgi:hypothetical protein